MKRLVKWIIISAILSEIVPLLSIATFVITIKGIDDVVEYCTSPKNYEEALVVCEATDSFMPDISELGDCEAVAFDYDTGTILFFEWKSTILSAKYDDENFDKQKQILDEKYIFLDKPIIEDYGTSFDYIIPKHIFESEDYIFRVVAGEEDEYWYPKYFGMIAYSEEENEILYLWFYDPDSDYITDMEDFVESYYPNFDDVV